MNGIDRLTREIEKTNELLRQQARFRDLAAWLWFFFGHACNPSAGSGLEAPLS